MHANHKNAGGRGKPYALAIYLCYSWAWPNNKSPCCVLTTMLVAAAQKIALFAWV